MMLQIRSEASAAMRTTWSWVRVCGEQQLLVME